MLHTRMSPPENEAGNISCTILDTTDPELSARHTQPVTAEIRR